MSSLSSQFQNIIKKADLSKRNRLSLPSYDVNPELQQPKAKPKAARAAKLTLVARSKEPSSEFFSYQILGSDTFVPLDVFVETYGLQAQQAVLAYDEQHSVEFEVNCVQELTGAHALISFKGYPAAFNDMVEIKHGCFTMDLMKQCSNLCKNLQF
jgi:hypothetical protein